MVYIDGVACLKKIRGRKSCFRLVQRENLLDFVEEEESYLWGNKSFTAPC